MKEKEERFRTKIQDMDRENVMFRYERENLEEAMSKLQEERDNARDMIEEAYQSYRSVSLFIKR